MIYQQGSLHGRNALRGNPAPARAARRPDFPTRRSWSPPERENSVPRREMNAPDASRTNPNGRNIFPTPQIASRTPRFPGWRRWNVSSASGNGSGPPGSWTAVRIAIRGLGFVERPSGNARIRSGSTKSGRGALASDPDGGKMLRARPIGSISVCSVAPVLLGILAYLLERLDQDATGEQRGRQDVRIVDVGAVRFGDVNPSVGQDAHSKMVSLQAG